MLKFISEFLTSMEMLICFFPLIHCCVTVMDLLIISLSYNPKTSELIIVCYFFSTEHD